MNHFDFPNDAADKSPEIDSSAPPPKEIGEVISGEFSESDNMLEGVFPAGEYGIEEEDRPIDEGAGASLLEAKIKDTPDNDSSEDANGPVSDQTPEEPDAAGSGEGGGGDEPGNKTPEEADDGGDGERKRIQRICINRLDFYYTILSHDSVPLSDHETQMLHKAAIELTGVPLGDAIPEVPFENPTPEDIVGKYFAEIDTGDVHTLPMLHREIYEESTLSAEANRHAEERTPQPLLEAAVLECAARGESPKELIKTGVSGLDERDRRQVEADLLVHYYALTAPQEGASTELKEEANAYIASLDAHSIKDIGEPAIRAATDRDIKNYAAIQYTMATEANTQKLREEGGDDTLKRAEAMAANMIDIASDLLLDNDVMYGMRDAISHMYGAAKQLKHENPDIDAERFHEYLALCDVKYMVGAGFPIEVIHADCLRYYDQGIRSRLESCAAIALTEAGATYDADVMLGLCHDSNHPNSYKFALLGCWENATLEQVQQFEPLWHFLPREEIRYVKKYYEYTLSALSDDTDTLAQNIREATLTPDISLQLKELSDRHPASKMLEQLVSLDRGKAETVCFEVLQTLGQRSDDRITTTLDNTEPYINMLAESNNPEYLNCALGVIDNATATFSQKILATAKLAKKLELRKSPGNN